MTKSNQMSHLLSLGQESFAAVGTAARKDLRSFWRAFQCFAESIALLKAKVSG